MNTIKFSLYLPAIVLTLTFFQPITGNFEEPCTIPRVRNGKFHVFHRRTFSDMNPGEIVGHGLKFIISCDDDYFLKTEDSPEPEDSSFVRCKNGSFGTVPACNSIETFLQEQPTTTTSKPAVRVPKILTRHNTATSTVSSTSDVSTSTAMSQSPETKGITDATRKPDQSEEIDYEENEFPGNEVNGMTTVVPELVKNCSFNLMNTNLVAFYKGQEVSEKKVTINLNENIILRCVELGSYFFTGDYQIVCTSKNWIGKTPRCKWIEYLDTYSPPRISYNVHGNSLVSENGTLLVEQDSNIEFDCWWLKSFGHCQWLFNGNQFRLANNMQEENKENNKLQLKIQKISLQQSGLYGCRSPYQKTNRIRIEVVQDLSKYIISRKQSTFSPVETTTPQSDATSDNSDHFLRISLGPVIRTVIPKIRRRTTTQRLAYYTVTRGLSATDSTRKFQERLHLNKTEETKSLGVTESMELVRPTVPAETAETKGVGPKLTIGRTCRAYDYSDLDVFENGIALAKEKDSFSDGTSLAFRCFSAQTKFEGASRILCINGEWSDIWPKCIAVKLNNPNAPPPVYVLASQNYQRLENGELLLPKQSGNLHFVCNYHASKPTILLQDKYDQRSMNKIMEYRNQYGYFIRMSVPSQAMQMKLACVIPETKVFNSLTIRIGDTCKLEESHIGNTFAASIAPSFRRPVYVEEDVVLLQCKNEGRKGVVVPKHLTCGPNGIWSIGPDTIDC